MLEEMDNGRNRIMWCPICEVVELERPLLKVIYEEIEELFEEILGEKE